MSNTQPTTKYPSWMDDLTYTDDVELTHTRALVYGPMGSGKTKFSLSWPKPLVIDLDHGLLTVRKDHHPRVTIHAPKDRRDRITVYQKVVAILAEARDLSGPFASGGELDDRQTIILDGYTALADALLKEIMLNDGLDPNNEKANYAHWASLSARLGSITDLAKQIPFNFVATCGDKKEQDEQTGGWIGLPDVVGGFRNDIGYKFDEVWYLAPRRAKSSDKDVSKENLVYEAHTAKYGIFDAKSRLDLPATIVSPTYEKVAPYLTDAT